MKILNIPILSFFVCLLTVIFVPTAVEAKSIIFNLPDSHTTGYSNGSGDGCGIEAWVDISSHVQYYAEIRNVDTNTLLNDGDTVSTGTRLRLEPKPFTNAETDIYWFGAGGHDDSPYGSWSTGAAYTGIGEEVIAIDPGGGCYDPLFSLAVNPPTPQFSFGGTATYSCTDPANCRVITAGSVSASVTFPQTIASGHNKDNSNGGGTSTFTLPAGHTYGPPVFLSNNGWTIYSMQDIGFPLTTTLKYVGFSMVFYWISPTFSTSIPAQTIPFSLNAITTNTAPAVPMVTGPAITPTGVSANYSATAIDPDNDTIRYAYDWNNDGTVDQYAPSSGYVSSGISQPLAHTYALSGPETIKVRAEDSNGGVSAWGSFSTSILANTSTTPNVTGPTTLTTGTNGTYTFTAIDPQGDQVRYGIDWDMNGSADTWLPAGVAYVNSGISQSTAHNWTTTGIKTFQVLTQDFQGLNSAWTAYNVTVSAPVACTTSNPSVLWNPCVTTPTQCVGLPSPRDVTGTKSGTCSDGSTGTVFQSCTVYGQVCTIAPVCPNALCESSLGETPITCPRDCKVKYKTF